MSVTGVKHLSRAEGLTPGDITDKFTFSITANEDGAPMPERVTATNDVNGSIDFGKIVFTLDALNKALGTTQQGATADTGAASIQSAAPAANDVVAAGTTAGVEVAGDSAMSAQAATGDDLAGNAADGAALSLQRLTPLPAQAMRLRAAMPTTRRQLLRLPAMLHRLPMQQPIMRRRAFRVLLLRRKLLRFAPMCSPMRLPKLAARLVLPTIPA